MPRILAIDHAGVMGGAEHSLLDLLIALKPGADVLLLADGPFRQRLVEAGIPVEVEALGASAAVRKSSGFPSPAAALDMWRVSRRIAKRAARYDVLYANSQKAFVAVALAGRSSGTRVVWHLRDILGPPHFSGFNVSLVTWLANRFASLVIANSQATADAFIAAGGRRGIVTVVHNGIDASPFDAVSPEAARALRASLGTSSSVPLVIHVGRFHPWKGQQVLLRALAIERRAHAWIVGAPLFGEEAFASELRALAAHLGLDGRVTFLGLRDDAPALLRAADIVVHSSTWPEPFGRVVVEGMLARKPVIAAEAGGVPEIIINDRTGFLVTPDDPVALASAITRAIDDPDRAREVAAAGAAQARRSFTREAMVEGVRRALATIS